MGQLILIVGNSAVGKTTLATTLCEIVPFATGFEQHIERPFQALMAADRPRYALANQVDYLLLRAEQERAIRARPEPGLIDGGLDLDFFGFTHLFYRRGYLAEAEYKLCERLYQTLRGLLGPPDLILYLTAPMEVIEQRYVQRGRALEIARREDLALMDLLIADWMNRSEGVPILHIDAGNDNFEFRDPVVSLLQQIHTILSVTR